MQFRVSVFGKNKILVEDIASRITRQGYFVMGNVFTKEDALNNMDIVMPHITIICLRNETADEIREYSILGEYPDRRNCEMIVIGDEKECDIFQRETGFKKVKYCNRPIVWDEVYKALEKCKVDLCPSDQALFQKKLNEVDDEVRQYEEERERRRQEEERLAQAGIKPGEQEQEQGQGDEDALSILVVDEDEEIVESVKKYLDGVFVVRGANSGTEAIKELAASRPTILLLNYALSDLDGIKVSTIIKTQLKMDFLPIIMMVDSPDPVVMKQIMGTVQPAGIILKPFNQVALLEKITKVMGG